MTASNIQSLRTNLVSYNWPAHIVAIFFNIEFEEMHFAKSNKLISTVVFIALQELLEIGNLLN